ncbi:hypothetical protein DL240_17685 [Lujinxingia litoralis]|uniref:FHA domain-containing protein n=1 Tax=Lujinxingia litoralis TaxID=2211119 RepID=A0A328C6S3_9DELT|nr:FHA domain-containing protein [Lujinxingia litoralis]RAL20214.1 hypothetical protein DL240_17685 [Lujinxingia litoralis]
MSDGKLSSKLQDEQAQTAQGEGAEGLSFRLGGRIRAPRSSGLDLPAYQPEEDEAVAAVAKRFRSGPGFGGAALKNAPTLDGDDAGAGDVDAGFLLDALEATAEPVTLAPLEDLGEVSITGRDLSQSSENLPLVEVEPLEESRRPAVCPSCHAENPASMKFCVECGGALAAPQKAGGQKVSLRSRVGSALVEKRREPPPASEAARQKNPWPIQLISINEDGSDGTAIALEFLETTVGREGDQRFPTDGFLSPRHARFHVLDGQLFIEDLYSLNGTFIKLRDETRLTAGDTILMGRQVLRFERFEQSITPKTKSSDGTRYMGSPAPGGTFKILQIGIGGIIQNVYCLPEAGAVLGREKGDIVFPHDKFMSGRHAQIYAGDDNQCYLVDLNSSNGTWIKIWEKTALKHRDYIFMGQQLFRVHQEQQG